MASSAGEALHQKLRSGDLSAAVGFAYQVFEKGYKGTAEDEKTLGSKKAAKAAVRSDAITFLEQAAEGGSLDAMLELTEFWFRGVREPGPFGSTLVIPKYRSCRPYLEQILNHGDSDDQEKALAAFRLGQTYKLVADQPQQAEQYWRKAFEIEPAGESGTLGRAALGEWLLYAAGEKRQAEAKPLLEAAAAEVASSAFALADGLRRGVWGEADADSAANWLKSGNDLLASKRSRG